MSTRDGERRPPQRGRKTSIDARAAAIVETYAKRLARDTPGWDPSVSDVLQHLHEKAQELERLKAEFEGEVRVARAAQRARPRVG